MEHKGLETLSNLDINALVGEVGEQETIELIQLLIAPDCIEQERVYGVLAEAPYPII